MFVCLFTISIVLLSHSNILSKKNVKNIFLNADFMCILFIYVTVSLIFFVLFYFASLYFILDMNTYYRNIHMYMYIHSYVYLYMYIYGNMCYFSKRLYFLNQIYWGSTYLGIILRLFKIYCIHFEMYKE